MAFWLRISVVLVLVVCARAGLAHEFWIEASEYQADTGATVEAGIFNGQDFNGVELAWFEGRVAAAHWAAGEVRGQFESRSGERPALKVKAVTEGLIRLIYQTTPSELTYSEWAKFVSFAESKGHGWAVERHLERGLAKEGVREVYTRYCKALVAVGNGKGADAAAGMRHEIVALGNPYGDVSQGLAVALFFEGKVLAGGQIDVFEKALDGTVRKTQVKSDADGQAVIPVRAGHRYLLDSVVLLEAEGGGVAWESLWASLTFEVP
ncbi:DUF4198 domain-containing protein [Rhodobacteraceae bacterium LMO-12]|nr:DUF4198 domain-containing protein [Rhodobacteraceae bacterium LMO-JJ12]